MKDIRSISGKLKFQLFMRGWRQGPERLWHHTHHHYTTESRWRVASGSVAGSRKWELIDGLTLRAAAKREGLLPR